MESLESIVFRQGLFISLIIWILILIRVNFITLLLASFCPVNHRMDLGITVTKADNQVTWEACFSVNWKIDDLYSCAKWDVARYLTELAETRSETTTFAIKRGLFRMRLLVYKAPVNLEMIFRIFDLWRHSVRITSLFGFSEPDFERWWFVKRINFIMTATILVRNPELIVFKRVYLLDSRVQR